MTTATYSATINRILDEIDRAGNYTSQAQLALESAISFYQEKAFWFNEERATASTVNAQEWYILPNDFADMYSLVINVNNNEYPLIQRTHNQIEDWFVSSTNYTGFPTDYAVYRQQLRLYPIPNGAYTMTMSYRKRPEALSADGSTNIFLEHAEELIRRRAEKDLSFSILQDQERALGFNMMETEVFMNLKSDTGSKVRTGKTRKRR